MTETSGVRYVVQAWHYAQYQIVGDGEVEILDEDDCNLALVAVRDTLEEAEEAAQAWNEACEAADEDGIMHQPISAINIFEVAASGLPREGKFVKTVMAPQWTGAEES